VFDLAGKSVFVAGHTGMVGRALMRRLKDEKVRIVEPSQRIDYRRQADVEAWMAAERPQVMFLAAARVGGIFANDNAPAEFIYDNLMIGANLIEAARHSGVEKLVYVGSSCIYPRESAQPIPESALLAGPLEPTNQWYAVAKIAGIKMTQAYRRQYGCDFISAQPTNLYGPFDNFDLSASHVIPALMRKAHDAKLNREEQLVVWGSGRPLREFMHVDDMADALVFLAKAYSGDDLVNIGSGEEVSIAELARQIAAVVGLEADLVFDSSKPDGTPRKLVDVSRLRSLGWDRARPLNAGLAETYSWFREHLGDARGYGGHSSSSSGD
jgi:GDP-L-fucose synthase